MRNPSVVSPSSIVVQCHLHDYFDMLPPRAHLTMLRRIERRSFLPNLCQRVGIEPAYFLLSEWQIICVVTCTFLRRDCCCNWRLLCYRLLCHLLTSSRYIVCLYLIIPFSLILIGINVKMYSNFFILCKCELLDPILAKYREHHVFRILTWDFQNIVASHPRIACALRYAFLRFKRMSHKSCYFHVFYLYSLMIDGMLLIRLICSRR